MLYVCWMARESWSLLALSEVFEIWQHDVCIQNVSTTVYHTCNSRRFSSAEFVFINSFADVFAASKFMGGMDTKAARITHSLYCIVCIAVVTVPFHSPCCPNTLKPGNVSLHNKIVSVHSLHVVVESSDNPPHPSISANFRHVRRIE